MKKYTVSLTHSEITMLIIDALRTSENATDEHVKREANSRVNYFTAIQNPPITSSQSSVPLGLD